MQKLTSINVKGGVDPRDPLQCQGNANKVQVPKELVAVHKLVLTLVDLDLDHLAFQY